ncbi:MAG: hypothetical protein FWG10_06245 [Eubacteriaceae bacterium]|nr:hypothetical protein [Eubacteriaceae bacterium]
MPKRTINGRSPGPSMLAIDSKSIKNAFTASGKGYDAGKKISGAKVRLGTGILGLPMAYISRQPILQTGMGQ